MKFEEQRQLNFETTARKAKAGASLCNCNMFIHEPTPGIFVNTENPFMQGEVATHVVDPAGKVKEYVPDMKTIGPWALCKKMSTVL